MRAVSVRSGVASLFLIGYNEAMSSDRDPARHPSIDAAGLDWVEVTDHGRRVRLHVRDDTGRPASLSLPACALNAVLSAVPAESDPRSAGATVHRLDGWSLGRGPDGFVLTLHRADGSRIAFAIAGWQIAAIASLAGQDAVPRDRLN